MGRCTCFISYSHEGRNMHKFNQINRLLNDCNEYINYSERENKSKFSDETIWKYLHDRIAGSSCTVLLLSKDLLYENSHKMDYTLGNFLESGWIYNEISASLRDWGENRINGVVCVVEDEIVNDISERGNVKNNALPQILANNSEYIVFAPFSQFMKNHNDYINKALENRNKQICYQYFKIDYEPHNKYKR